MSSSIGLTGMAGVEKMLDSVDDQARQNLERRAVRAGGKVVAKAMAVVAASSHVPYSFAKIKLRVSASMRSGGIPHALVRPNSPLFNIFEPGAGSHTIAPKMSGPYLRGRRGHKPKNGAPGWAGNRHIVFETHPELLAGPMGESSWTSEGRKRPDDFFSTEPVTHPGMGARPIMPRTAAMSAREAQQAMAAIIFGQAPGTALGSVG